MPSLTAIRWTSKTKGNCGRFSRRGAATFLSELLGLSVGAVFCQTPPLGLVA
jgi:hypothetical protein